jgi:8-oxo-dGTP pyrophosphatase MutT (NUDIX family)
MAITTSSDAGSECGEPREPVVPRLAATVALVRDGADGLEVYLMRRPATMSFAPGVWVVPGGSVDPLDTATAGVPPSIGTAATAGPAGTVGPAADVGTAASASAATAAGTAGAVQPGEAVASVGVSIVDVDGWGRTGLSGVDAGRVLAAAVREVFEETAVLLATDRSGQVPGLPTGRRVRARGALRSGRRRLADVLDGEGLRLDGRLLVPWSRWITPAWVPTRRFDTYFFVAELPAGQQPVRARTEASAARWLRPADALDRHARGRMQLMIPTRAFLAALAEVSSLATLRAELPWRPPDPDAMPPPPGDHAERDRRMRGADRQTATARDDEGRRRR